MHIVPTSFVSILCACLCGNFALCQVSLHPLCFHFCIKHGGALGFSVPFLLLSTCATCCDYLQMPLHPCDAHSFAPFAASSRCFLALHNLRPPFCEGNYAIDAALRASWLLDRVMLHPSVWIPRALLTRESEVGSRQIFLLRLRASRLWMLPFSTSAASLGLAPIIRPIHLVAVRNSANGGSSIACSDWIHWSLLLCFVGRKRMWGDATTAKTSRSQAKQS